MIQARAARECAGPGPVGAPRATFIQWPAKHCAGLRMHSRTSASTGRPRPCACIFTQSMGVVRVAWAKPEAAPATSAPNAVSGRCRRASANATNITELSSTEESRGGPRPRANAAGPSLRSIIAAQPAPVRPGRWRSWIRTFTVSSGCPTTVEATPPAAEQSTSSSTGPGIGSRRSVGKIRRAERPKIPQPAASVIIQRLGVGCVLPSGTAA